MASFGRGGGGQVAHDREVLSANPTDPTKETLFTEPADL